MGQAGEVGRKSGWNCDTFRRMAGCIGNALSEFEAVCDLTGCKRCSKVVENPGGACGICRGPEAFEGEENFSDVQAGRDKTCVSDGSKLTDIGFSSGV